MLVRICLALSLFSVVSVAQEVAVEIRAQLEPLARIDFDRVLLGATTYGLVLKPNDIVHRDLGSGVIEFVRLGDELEVRHASWKRPQRISKAGLISIATPDGLAELQCTPYRAALPGVVSSSGSIATMWLVQRLNGRPVHFDGLPALQLLDANLNGSFTDFGADLVLQEKAPIALHLSHLWCDATRWWSLKAEASELVLTANEDPRGTLLLTSGADLPAAVDRIVVRSASGEEVMLAVDLEPMALPLGKYRLVHATCGDRFELLSGSADWCEIKADLEAQPSLGAPYRLSARGTGFRDPMISNGSFSSSSNGGSVMFLVEAVQVIGSGGETWDLPRYGLHPRLTSISSFVEAKLRIGTTQKDGKAGKSVSWCFAKNGPYTSPATVSDRTASLWIELEPKPFPKLRAEFPLGM